MQQDMYQLVAAPALAPQASEDKHQPGCFQQDAGHAPALPDPAAVSAAAAGPALDALDPYLRGSGLFDLGVRACATATC